LTERGCEEACATIPHICQLLNDIKPLGAKTCTFFSSRREVRIGAAIQAAEEANRVNFTSGFPTARLS